MNKFADIRAVTFDVGGTLIEPWPSVGHVYAEAAARHGVKNVSPELLTGRFKTAWRARKEFAYVRSAWAELVDEAFAGLCAEPPSKTFFAELYDLFEQPQAWRVFDDVLPTLNQLASANVRLAVISNWDERLRPLLKRLDLAGFFRAIIVSCEVGSAKPSPAIFQSAAQQLKLPPDSILHVGDSLELDAQGAASAGFHALQILRGHNAAGNGGRDDGILHSLAGLPARLGISASKTHCRRG